MTSLYQIVSHKIKSSSKTLKHRAKVLHDKYAYINTFFYKTLALA